MKNKYLTKCFCITLFSAMVVSGSMAVCAAEETGTLKSGTIAAEPEELAVIVENNSGVTQEPTPTVTPVPKEEILVGNSGSAPETIMGNAAANDREEMIADSTPGEGEVTPIPTPGEVTPSPIPGVEEVTPTPGEGEVTPTPTPGEGEVTPTPTPGEGEVTPTPTPGEGEVTPTPTPGEGEVTPTPTPGEGEVTPTPGEGEVTPTPTPGEGEVAPSPIPGEGEITPTPGEGEVTPTPTPGEGEVIPSPTPGEGEVTPSPIPGEGTITPKPDGEKSDVFGDTESSVKTDTIVVMPSTILTSAPVYYTSMVSNLHAGKEFYLNSLKSNYQITFSDGFASVMEQIEKEYKAKYKISDRCDKRADGLTSSEDSLLVYNWQDIIAIYIYEKSKEGYTEFYLNELCKDDLARIFEELNPIVRDKKDITRVTYANRHINYYIKEHNISKEDRELLKKYVETDCKLLCSVVTGSKGLVRQSVGEGVSEERVNVIAAAYSLVGEVGYFWGGKSNRVGMNANWGTAEFVTAAGSNSTGTLRAYGLDCSGFVSWAVINGYKNAGMLARIGEGTSNQWVNAQVISEAEAQPGDLVFQSGPESGENNHVGIICGQTEDGDWIVVHCSSSKNGVTVGEAYSAGFRYIRQPSVYPSEEQVSIMEKQFGYTGTNAGSEVFVTDNLQSLISQTGIGSGENGFVSGFSNEAADTFMDDIEISTFDDGMVVDDIQTFSAE